MSTIQHRSALHIPLHKYVQKTREDSVEIPSTAILASSLKTLELRLQQRGFLKPPRAEFFTPLWFLSETERNIFLWRRGESLIEQDNYEFWVDIRALIDKRIRQLESANPDNPLTNSIWEFYDETGSPDLSRDLMGSASQLEIDYLRSFLKLTGSIIVHAHALSQVGSMLENELHQSWRIRIVLPAGKSASCSARSLMQTEPEANTREANQKRVGSEGIEPTTR